MDDEDVPYVLDAQANITCVQDGRMSYGTHDVIVGKVAVGSRRRCHRTVAIRQWHIRGAGALATEQGLTAIDNKRLADDPARCWRSEEQHDICDFIGLAKTASGNGRDVLQIGGIVACLAHFQKCPGAVMEPGAMAFTRMPRSASMAA
ncbi:MAG: hypothetical protein WDM89_11890 [Rhizomicrobium sp.]